MRRSWVVVAAAVLASACGTTDLATEEPDPDDGTPLVLVGGEVQIGCGSSATVGWPPSVMDGGVPGVVDREEIVAAFRQFLVDPELSVVVSSPSTGRALRPPVPTPAPATRG